MLVARLITTAGQLVDLHLAAGVGGDPLLPFVGVRDAWIGAIGDLMVRISEAHKNAGLAVDLL